MADRLYRTVKRRTPKQMKKDYVCSACHGTVRTVGRQPVEAVREIHEDSCPAARKKRA